MIQQISAFSVNHICDQQESIYKDERDKAKFQTIRNEVLQTLECNQQGGGASTGKQLNFQSEIMSLVDKVVLALFGFQNDNQMFFKCYKSQFQDLFVNLILSNNVSEREFFVKQTTKVFAEQISDQIDHDDLSEQFMTVEYNKDHLQLIAPFLKKDTFYSGRSSHFRRMSVKSGNIQKSPNFNTLQQESGRFGSKNRLQFAVSSMQGWRTSMEDTHLSIPNLTERFSLFGIFDGHGGGQVSKYLKDKFVD